MAFNNEMLSYFANKMWSKNKDTFVSKETGKSLSTNDYTNEDKNKLDNLSAETTTYDNTTSGLTSTNVQGAIDEINTELSTKSDSTHNHDDSYYTKTEINSKLSDLPTGAESTSCDMNIFGKKVKKIDYECDALDTFHNSLKIETSVLPYKFSSGSAVVYNNEIHILGGNDSSTYTKHYKYDGTSWTEVGTLHYEFRTGGAVVYNNEIHILGSNYGDSTLTKHYKYDGTSWTEVSTLPYNFYAGSAVVYNNEIHILGGSNNNYEMVDVSHGIYTGNKWLYIENILPYKFANCSAVVYNNEIHILGGSGNSDSACTKHYKWNGISWTEVSTLPYNFCWGGAVVYNNEIHILGGNSDSTRTKHYKYDGASWTEVGTLPYEFSNGSVVIYNNEIHILGGSYDNIYHYNHYKYDGTSWTEVGKLPYEFCYGCAVVLQGIAFILGGTYDKRKWAESDLDYSTLRVKSVYYQ